MGVSGSGGELISSRPVGFKVVKRVASCFDLEARTAARTTHMMAETTLRSIVSHVTVFVVGREKGGGGNAPVQGRSGM